jgi:putative Mg2+ transporter-C (MgtC) family protein
MEPSMDLPISHLEVAARLGAAVLVGSMLGLNRELRDKPAGLKTHVLVSIGACVLTIASLGFAVMSGQPDGAAVARVIQGVITGIGFLGAGVILRDPAGEHVHGLTTAATIWLAACLGVACGAGQWPLVMMGTGITLLVLLLGDPLERLLYRKVKGRSQPEAESTHTGNRPG